MPSLWKSIKESTKQFMKDTIDITKPMYPIGWTIDANKDREGRAMKNFHKAKGFMGVTGALMRYEVEDLEARLDDRVARGWRWLSTVVSLIRYVVIGLIMVQAHAIHDGIPFVLNALKLALCILASPYLVPRDGAMQTLETMGKFLDVMIAIPTKIVLDIIGHVAFIIALPFKAVSDSYEDWKKEQEALDAQSDEVDATENAYLPEAQPVNGQSFEDQPVVRVINTTAAPSNDETDVNDANEQPDPATQSSAVALA